MTIHWKAVEKYFTVVLFVKPLTPRVKARMIERFLTFDSMGRPPNRFNFSPVCNFEKNRQYLDLELAGVKLLTSSVSFLKYDQIVLIDQNSPRFFHYNNL